MPRRDEDRMEAPALELAAVGSNASLKPRDSSASLRSPTYVRGKSKGGSSGQSGSFANKQDDSGELPDPGAARHRRIAQKRWAKLQHYVTTAFRERVRQKRIADNKFRPRVRDSHLYQRKVADTKRLWLDKQFREDTPVRDALVTDVLRGATHWHKRAKDFDEHAHEDFLQYLSRRVPQITRGGTPRELSAFDPEWEPPEAAPPSPPPDSDDDVPALKAVDFNAFSFGPPAWKERPPRASLSPEPRAERLERMPPRAATVSPTLRPVSRGTTLRRRRERRWNTRFAQPPQPKTTFPIRERHSRPHRLERSPRADKGPPRPFDADYYDTVYEDAVPFITLHPQALERFPRKVEDGACVVVCEPKEVRVLERTLEEENERIGIEEAFRLEKRMRRARKALEQRVGESLRNRRRTILFGVRNTDDNL